MTFLTAENVFTAILITSAVRDVKCEVLKKVKSGGRKKKYEITRKKMSRLQDVDSWCPTSNEPWRGIAVKTAGYNPLCQLYTTSLR